ncbi:magnesium protoporphyrin IX methyltransferase [Leptolyngbya cf. ectocarpi LEGE 11479]|uniref:Magnesium protoporphyrin IX methyltransferase n=1 Tax=Leptolyngbya cf. ectocarpi LEGE 11479 TaxID=1828722 RepID=A0A928ZTX6_LEPEC|nr:magnesium protoporphyrin IX methyltransferase [Leptolyngbya ectocarpi]MBE9067380.1 magnesium protoporphyrin IX methyltransferase [Leptolyngbya cf. ectocarpi LEGE 11479]
MTSATDDKTIVRNYFNAQGFDRWSRIYGDGQVNKVQRDIRDGHQQTVDHVLYWFKQDGNAEGLTVCDAGCGVGSLSIPLAAMGARVSASDISEKMVEEASIRAKDVLQPEAVPTFEAKDLETLDGSYHTVVCLDVLIHYPQDKAGDMLAHLSALAQERLIVSFAPKNPFYTVLKRIGEFFPGPSKATRAYLHSEAEIRAALKANGWEIKRQEFTATQFYFSRLLEAVKASD